MDKIIIRGLEVYANHGCFPQENLMGQRFFVNLEAAYDLKLCAARDDLDLAVSYADLCDDITAFLKSDTLNLIETAAVRLARFIMKKYRRIDSIILELEKPQAPLPYSFNTVLAHVERSRHIAYIGLGGNLGERRNNINSAIKMLDGHEEIKVLDTAKIYETAPYGVKDQPDFLNTCVSISTTLDYEELLIAVHEIEDALGRERELRWGPRTIDLDILLFDSEIVDKPHLHIPHIDMKNRLFVLKPLADIAGYVRHPLYNKTIDEMLTELEVKLKKKQ